MRKTKNIRFVLLMSIAFGMFSVVYSQNPRSTPKPLATPPRTVTGAEIISLADELYNSPIVLPAESSEAKPVSDNAEIRELLERIKKLEGNRPKEAGAKKADPDEVQ